MCKDDKQTARRLALAVADEYFICSGYVGRVRVPSGLVSAVVRFARVFGVPSYFINIAIKGV
jgi:hypothetical protein